MNNTKSSKVVFTKNELYRSVIINMIATTGALFVAYRVGRRHSK